MASDAPLLAYDGLITEAILLVLDGLGSDAFDAIERS